MVVVILFALALFCCLISGWFCTLCSLCTNAHTHSYNDTQHIYHHPVIVSTDFDSFDALKILAFEAFSLESQFWKTKRKSTSTQTQTHIHNPLISRSLYLLDLVFGWMPWNMNVHMCPCHSNVTYFNSRHIERLCAEKYRYCWTKMSPFIIIIHSYLECCRCVQMYVPLNWN